jgi:hypothetical protein
VPPAGWRLLPARSQRGKIAENQKQLQLKLISPVSIPYEPGFAKLIFHFQSHMGTP